MCCSTTHTCCTYHKLLRADVVVIVLVDLRVHVHCSDDGACVRSQSAVRGVLCAARTCKLGNESRVWHFRKDANLEAGGAEDVEEGDHLLLVQRAAVICIKDFKAQAQLGVQADGRITSAVVVW